MSRFPEGGRASFDSLIAQNLDFFWSDQLSSSLNRPLVMLASRMSDGYCLTCRPLPIPETIAVTQSWDSPDWAYWDQPKARVSLPLRFCVSPTVEGRYGGDVHWEATNNSVPSELCTTFLGLPQAILEIKNFRRSKIQGKGEVRVTQVKSMICSIFQWVGLSINKLVLAQTANSWLIVGTLLYPLNLFLRIIGEKKKKNYW